MNRIIGIWLLLAAAIAVGQDSSPQDPPELTQAPAKPKALVIDLSDEDRYMVDTVVSEHIIEQLDRAEAEGFERVILDIDTYGGQVISARNINEALLRLNIPTTAYIASKAISAGAFVAWACDDIVMEENATIGDAQMIMQTPQGIEVAPEKMVTLYRSDWKKASDSKGRSFAFARGFFEVDAEVLQVGEPDDFDFMLRIDYDELAEDERPPILKTVVRGGELLTLTALEAADYGIVEITDDFESYLSSLGLEPSQAEETEMRMGQRILRFMGSNPWLYVLLVLVGLNGLYVELKAPGFGIPGLTALVCFTIIFGSRFFLGTADPVEIGLFAIGLLLCVVEIFVLPGLGFTGILGLMLMFGSLVMSSLPDFGGWPETDMQWDMIWQMTVTTGSAFALSLITVFMILPALLKTPLAQRHILPNEMASADGYRYDTVADQKDTLKGQTGAAMGDLRPTGKIRLDDGRYFDVVSDGMFVDDGARVKVHHVDGNRIVVRPTEEQS